MKILDVADPITLAALVRQDPNRSPGLHLSTIIKDIMVTLEPERFKSGTPGAGWIGVGLAFEDVLADAIRAVIGPGGYRPGEFKKDGIAMSPDWIAGDGMLEEWKATWVSGKDGLDTPKLSRYHMQAKAYAHVLGMNVVRFRVLWVNGGKDTAYFDHTPDLRTYECHYSKQELRDNWHLMVTHARDMGVLK